MDSVERRVRGDRALRPPWPEKPPRRPGTAGTGARGARSRVRVLALLGLLALALALATGPGAGAAPSAGTATLGKRSVGPALDPGGPGYLDVSGPYTTRTGAIAALTAYVAGEASALSVRGVVYRNAHGRPGTLVATTREVRIAAGATATWVRFPFAHRITLAGGGYWLGFWYGGGTGSHVGGFAYTSRHGSERYARAGYSPGGRAPAAFPGGGAASDSVYSVYATLTLAAAPHANAEPARRHRAAPTKTRPKSTAKAKGKRAAKPTAGTGHRSDGIYEDTREGFPKIAAYRPGCSARAQTAAAFDWFVADGSCASTLDQAVARNRHLLGMIQPSMTDGSGNLFAATYGAYDLTANPLSDPAIGSIRAFKSSDLLRQANGSQHAYGTVNVLDWLSRDTALWSADVDAYWARRNGAASSAHPGVMGVWGDNDFWSDQSYAFSGTALDPATAGASTAAANRAAWDTNFVAHHERLAHDLPGMVIGGNDIASYSDNPGAYQGSTVNGWLLPGVSAAGMRECADKYFGLYSAAGIDGLIAAAQRFLAGEALDGRQRYLMLNNCNASNDGINEYSLAVATIGGFYYWPYTNADWATTLTIAPSIPDVTRNGARNWLGFPTAAPQKLASGLWKRTFQHGSVYVNMTGSTRSVDGHTLANETGLFVGG